MCHRVGHLLMKIKFEKISHDHKYPLAKILSEPCNNMFNPNPPDLEHSLITIDEWIALTSSEKIMYHALLVNDQVVGMGGVKLKYLQNYGSFANLYFRVSHLYARQGLGRIIAEKGINDAQKNNLRCIAITRKLNLPAINLLKSLKFSEISIASCQIEKSQICFSCPNILK